MISYGIQHPVQEDLFVEKDVFCSKGKLFTICQMLGHVNQHMRPQMLAEDAFPDNPEMRQVAKETYQWLDQYIEEKQEEALDAFDDFVDFCRDTALQKLEEGGHSQHNQTYFESISVVSPEFFDPEMRALFGRLIFLDVHVDPEDAGNFAIWCHGLIGVMRPSIDQFKESSDPEDFQMAHNLEITVECLAPLTAFAETRSDSDLGFMFDF